MLRLFAKRWQRELVIQYAKKEFLESKMGERESKMGEWEKQNR